MTMRLRPAIVAVLLAWTLAAAQQPPFANSAPVLPCKDHTVDEYLSEMHQRHRNKNPLPDCVLSWCRETGADQREPAPAPQPSQVRAEQGQAGESSSASTAAAATTGLQNTSLAYRPVAAARNTEAGDYYFSEKNYRAALSRFQEALEDKPDDAAIHLRLGRTYEKLNDPIKAFEHFDAALILAPDGPGAKAAGDGLERLRPQLEKAGIDTAKIHQRNAAAIAASCPAAKP
jgi:tetratricopeptide (TPR) repeat protein